MDVTDVISISKPDLKAIEHLDSDIEMSDEENPTRKEMNNLL